ncbi:hypothetical protein ACFXN3_00325, partial [Streptomyces sp. NPDC059165]
MSDAREAAGRQAGAESQVRRAGGEANGGGTVSDAREAAGRQAGAESQVRRAGGEANGGGTV